MATLFTSPQVSDHVVSSLARRGFIHQAAHTLMESPHRSAFAWTALISASAATSSSDAFKLFDLMQEDGIQPNPHALMSLSKACGSRSLRNAARHGHRLHGFAARTGLSDDPCAACALLRMYGRLGLLPESESIFCRFLSESENKYGRFRPESESKSGRFCPESESKSGRFFPESESKSGRFCPESESKFRHGSDPDPRMWNAMLSVYVEHGRAKRALLLYRQMQAECGSIAAAGRATFMSVFQACGILGSGPGDGDCDGDGDGDGDSNGSIDQVLLIGRALHADARSKSAHLFDAGDDDADAGDDDADAGDASFATALIDMYCKCGAVEEAEHVFCALREPDVVSWNALMSGYVADHADDQVLRSYVRMQQQGIEPNPCTMVFALKACTMGASEQEKEKKKEKKEKEREEKPMAVEIIGRAIHGDCLARGLFPASRFIATQLINMYSGFGDLRQAEEAFVRCSRRDGIAWNAMLLAYVEHGFARRALLLYRQMQEEEGARLDHVSFAGACQACTILAESKRAEEEEEEATKLAKSRSLEIGFSAYSDARRQGRGRWVAPSLIALCSRFGAMSEATHVFVSSPHQDAVMWTSLVSAFADDGRRTEALQLFRHMQAQGVVPSRHSFVCALKACGAGGKSSSSSIGSSGEEDGGSASSAAPLEICRALHADIAKRSELVLDPLLATTLLAVYARCSSSADEADAIFLVSPRPGGIVPWNATISACVDRGDAEKALRLYRDMLRIEPGWIHDRRTMELAIRACGRLRRSCRSEIADALHADAIQGGHASDSAFASSLATMHYKCGFAQKARAALTALPAPAPPDAWNAFLLTAAHGNENRPDKTVLELYREMSNRGVAIDRSSLIAVLRCCGESRSLDTCRGVHFGVVSGGCETAPQVAAGLMRAYGQCASALESWLVLEEFEEPDIVLWTAGIQGYAAEGNASGSLRMYESLKLSGACPDPVSFSCVLSACAHDGLVPECLGYFEEITRGCCETVPGLRHYGLLVDGLGRAGDFRRLESLWRSLPMPADVTMYVSLLAACRAHGGCLELAETAFDQAVNLAELEQEVSSMYVLMSNMYTNAGF